MKIRIYKAKTISASHYLPNYEGNCANLHGHNYKVEVLLEVEADLLTSVLDKSGILLDFNVISDIISSLDHKHLNDIIPIPSTENLAHYILAKIASVVSIPFSTLLVRVWESNKSYVEIEAGGEMYENAKN